MEKFIEADSDIHNISRGLLMQGNEVVLCHTGEADWYFLPGGHIEEGESAKAALKRELQEELVEAEFKITSFVGACENVFSLDDGIQHEVNIVFEVNFGEGIEVSATEGHIEFVTVPKEKLSDYNVLPSSLHEGVLEWIKNQKCFFKEIKG